MSVGRTLSPLARAVPGRGMPSRLLPVPALAIAIGLALLLPAVQASAAQAPIDLGTSGSFAVLGGSGITNTGATTVTGDVGTFPTPSETGFGTMTLNGVDHGGDAVTQQAKTDLTTAYNQAAAATPPTSVPTELGGTTLTPGVYSGATLAITGTLSLDTLGDPNAVFVFQTASTLITAAGSAVTVINGGTACNVFWQVSSSATLGANSLIIGTVLASTSITATTGATIDGRLLAEDGAVTLDHNTISGQSCSTATTTTTAVATTTTTATATTTTTASSSAAAGLGGSSPTTATPNRSTSRNVTTSGAGTRGPGRGATPAITQSSIPNSLAATGADGRLPIGGALVLGLGVGAVALSTKLRRSEQ